MNKTWPKRISVLADIVFIVSIAALLVFQVNEHGVGVIWSILVGAAAVAITIVFSVRYAMSKFIEVVRIVDEADARQDAEYADFDDHYDTVVMEKPARHARD